MSILGSVLPERLNGDFSPLLNAPPVFSEPVQAETPGVGNVVKEPNRGKSMAPNVPGFFDRMGQSFKGINPGNQYLIQAIAASQGQLAKGDREGAVATMEDALKNRIGASQHYVDAAINHYTNITNQLGQQAGQEKFGSAISTAHKQFAEGDTQSAINTLDDIIKHPDARIDKTFYADAIKTQTAMLSHQLQKRVLGDAFVAASQETDPRKQAQILLTSGVDPKLVGQLLSTQVDRFNTQILPDQGLVAVTDKLKGGLDRVQVLKLPNGDPYFSEKDATTEMKNAAGAIGYRSVRDLYAMGNQDQLKLFHSMIDPNQPKLVDNDVTALRRMGQPVPESGKAKDLTPEAAQALSQDKIDQEKKKFDVTIPGRVRVAAESAAARKEAVDKEQAQLYENVGWGFNPFLRKQIGLGASDVMVDKTTFQRADPQIPTPEMRAGLGNRFTPIKGPVFNTLELVNRDIPNVEAMYKVLPKYLSLVKGKPFVNLIDMFSYLGKEASVPEYDQGLFKALATELPVIQARIAQAGGQGIARMTQVFKNQIPRTYQGLDMALGEMDVIRSGLENFRLSVTGTPTTGLYEPQQWRQKRESETRKTSSGLRY